MAGSDRIEAILNDPSVACHASSINLGEVLSILERREGVDGAEAFLGALTVLPIAVADATWQRVVAAAHVKATHPLSYADAFAVALAREIDATVVTGDPEFRAVEPLVRVEWLSRA